MEDTRIQFIQKYTTNETSTNETSTNETSKNEKTKSPKQTKTNHKIKAASQTSGKQSQQKQKQKQQENYEEKKKSQDKKNKVKTSSNDEDYYDDGDDDEEWVDEEMTSSDDDYDDEYETEVVLDESTYATLLNQLFPSSYSKEKAKNAEKKKQEEKKKQGNKQAKNIKSDKKNGKKNETNETQLSKKTTRSKLNNSNDDADVTDGDQVGENINSQLTTKSKTKIKTSEEDKITNKKFKNEKNKTKKNKSKEEIKEESKEVTKENKKNKTSQKSKRKKPQMIIEELDDEESEEYVPSTEETETDSETDSDDDEELEAELMELLSGKGLQKFNIIFEIGGDEYDDEDEYETDDETDSDDDNEDLDEDDFKDYTKEDYERDIKLLDQFNKMSTQLIKDDKNKNSAVLNFMNDESKYLKKSVEKFQKKNEKNERKQNMKKFKKIASGNKKRFNEKTFFEQRSLEEQKKILCQMEEINALTTIDMPYKFKLLETDIPLPLKSCAMKKIEMFKHMDPGMSEYYKLKNWIDTFMEIPFGKYKGLPVSIDDGVEKCREFMTTAKKTLDNVAFGLDDAKMQIIQMIGTWITNPEAIGSAIAIQGPPGTGKTTLVKEGISKILGRDFAFIALGGATDSSYLEGHGYTYEGSKWGKIVDILVQSKSMNPIIYFDELDKISDTPKGEEIVGILTHLTDTTQNSNFHDKYFSEIDFDLSKCLFIFSYNDESKINPILKDRMYRIYTQGYDKKQKQIIAREYLMPNIRNTIKFGEDDIIIGDEVIDYINMNYVEDEKGVRNMKRCLEIIYTKLNLYRFIDSDSQFFDEQGKTNETQKKEKQIKIKFPLTLTRDIIDKLLKRNKLQDGYPHLYL